MRDEINGFNACGVRRSLATTITALLSGDLFESACSQEAGEAMVCSGCVSQEPFFYR